MSILLAKVRTINFGIIQVIFILKMKILNFIIFFIYS